MKMEASVDPQCRGPDSMPITPKTGSLFHAETQLAAHRHAYPVFTQSQQNTVAQALFDERIVSVFGWPMVVHAETKRRTLLNYPAQSNGRECMRLAAIAAFEAGIRIAAR